MAVPRRSPVQVEQVDVRQKTKYLQPIKIKIKKKLIIEVRVQSWQRINWGKVTFVLGPVTRLSEVCFRLSCYFLVLTSYSHV